MNLLKNVNLKKIGETPHSGYIDADDNDIFSKFIIEQRERLKGEFDESGRLLISPETYKNIGNVSYMLPEFAERVKQKYNQKRNKLESLIF